MLRKILTSQHSVENSRFFCHSDFTWNQFLADLRRSKSAIWPFLQLWSLNLWYLRVCNFSNKSECKASKIVKLAFSTFWNQPILISRETSGRKIAKFAWIHLHMFGHTLTHLTYFDPFEVKEFQQKISRKIAIFTIFFTFFSLTLTPPNLEDTIFSPKKCRQIFRQFIPMAAIQFSHDQHKKNTWFLEWDPKDWKVSQNNTEWIWEFSSHSNFM